MMVYFNADVWCGKINEIVYKYGLQEVLVQRYANKTPATHQSNTQNIPIDGIFGLVSITILKGGSLGF